MNLKGKELAMLIGLMLMYIFLSIMGIYNTIGIVLFPVLALPFAFYCMRHHMGLREHLIFNVGTILGIGLLSGSYISSLIYIMAICIPAYIIYYFYSQELPLPNIIMYFTLSLSVLVFIVLAIVKHYGFDFEAEFIASIDHTKLMVNKSIQEMIEISKQSVSTTVSQADAEAVYTEWFKYFETFMETMKTYYASIMMLSILFFSTLAIVVFNSILRVKDKALVSKLGQLFEFRVSKVAVIVLVLAMLIVEQNGETLTSWSILGENIILFLMVLFQLAGALALIGILKNKVVRTGFRILGYLGVIIAFSVAPYLVMFFGCVDSIFNYRKVKIIV